MPTIISGLGKYTTGTSGKVFTFLSSAYLTLAQSKPSSDPYRLISSRQFGPSACPTLLGSSRSTAFSSRRRPRSQSSATSCSSRAATLKSCTGLRSSRSPVLVRSLSLFRRSVVFGTDSGLPVHSSVRSVLPRMGHRQRRQPRRSRRDGGYRSRVRFLGLDGVSLPSRSGQPCELFFNHSAASASRALLPLRLAPSSDTS